METCPAKAVRLGIVWRFGGDLSSLPSTRKHEISGWSFKELLGEFQRIVRWMSRNFWVKFQVMFQEIFGWNQLLGECLTNFWVFGEVQGIFGWSFKEFLGEFQRYFRWISTNFWKFKPICLLHFMLMHKWFKVDSTNFSGQIFWNIFAKP